MVYPHPGLVIIRLLVYPGLVVIRLLVYPGLVVIRLLVYPGLVVIRILAYRGGWKKYTKSNFFEMFFYVIGRFRLFIFGADWG